MVFGCVYLKSDVSFITVRQGAGVVLWGPFEVVEFAEIYWDFGAD